MAIENRKQLLAALRDQCGYKGKEDIAEIEKFITDNGIEVDGDWKKAFEKTVTIKISTDAGESVTVEDGNEVESDESETEMEGEKSAKKPSRINKAAAADARSHSAMSPVSSGRISARKRYNAKVGKINPATGKGYVAFDDADKAEAWGAWVRLAVAGSNDYPQKAIDADIVGKTLVTTTNTLGGALVPDDFAATLIDLKEDRGVARRVCPVIPMSRDTLTMPRRTGGLTVYAPGEAAAITASDPAFNSVELVARKMACLTRSSRELFNDSAINVADQLAREIAYAFADKEDECFFNGDGTSTFFGVVGVRSALTALSGTIANIAGLTVAAGNAYSEIVYDDFLEVMSDLPEYAARGNVQWVFSRPFQFQVVERVSRALGSAGTGVAGATYTEAISAAAPRFFGYPVSVSQVMPRTEANSQVCALVGDFSQAAKFGEVRGSMEIATSTERFFDSDEIAIRGIQRVAMTVHDVGNASATAASRVPGPVVGLITAAS